MIGQESIQPKTGSYGPRPEFEDMTEAKCLRPLVLPFNLPESIKSHPSSLPERVWVLQARMEGVAVGSIVQRHLTLSRCKIMS